MAKKQKPKTETNSVASTEPSPQYQHEGLRSLKLELENFKNIEKKVIDIGGKSMLFLGKNGSGKSTIIQAMMSPMDSKLLPSEPIRIGEERARISHKIGGNINGEYVEYIMDIHFSPKNNTGRLVLTNEKGETIPSPASKIKSIIGNVSFDVTKWLNDTKAKKLETIKNLTGCGKEIDLINMEITRLKTDGKYKKERCEQLEGSLNVSLGNEFTPEERDYYSHPADMVVIQQEYNQVATAQQTWDGIKNKLDGFYKDVQRAQENVNKAHDEISRLKALIAQQEAYIITEGEACNKNQENCQKGEEWLNKNKRPSIDVVTEKMNGAVQHNEKHNRIITLGTQHREMLGLKDEIEGIKGLIIDQEAMRNNVIGDSQLPIPGLTFTDEEIFIDGLPLEQGQVNTAKLFDIGVDVAIALNPNLKIVFLHDGSLFDKDHLRSIITKIESNGYMAIVEMVAENNEVEAVFTESYL